MSDNLGDMRISEVIAKKDRKVRVRMPAGKLKEIGGKPARLGVVKGVKKRGSITWVQVQLTGKGGTLEEFRPQDLSAA